MPPLMRLPSYEIPQNALLDLAPFERAIDRSNQVRQQDRQYGIQQEQLGMQRERFGMEKQKFASDRDSEVKRRIGGLALLTLQKPEAEREAAWKSVLALHPEAAKLGPQYGDARTGPLALLADAGMAGDYLTYQMRQQEAARAAAADQRAAAVHPYQLEQAQLGNEAARLNLDVRRRELETPKMGAEKLKEGETLQFYDPRTGKSIGQLGSSESTSDGKFRDAAATDQVSRYSETVKQGAAQNQAIGTVQSLRQFSDRIGAPGVGNTIARTLGPGLRSVGIEVGNLSDMEAFQAIVSRLVPSQRPPGSGTMSDKDVELFKQSLPQLSATSQGRKFILDQMEAIARYDLQRSQIASRALNGEMPRQAAEQQLRSLPDPMELFRRQTGQTGGASAGAPAATGGQLFHNPTTGEVIEWKDGQWVPHNTQGAR